MISESVERVTHEDLARGEWCINWDEMNAWVNASSLALGVLLQREGDMLEDACWLQPENDAWHINLSWMLW